MRHYWILGVFGLALFFIAQRARGGHWFEKDRHVHVAVAPVASQAGGDWEWSGRIGAGKTVEVKGVNGDVRAERAAGGEVEVHARKTSRRSDISSVRIDLVEHAEGITVCAVYPARRSHDNACQPGGNGLSANRNDVKVDFVVRIPDGVAFAGQTVNGSVRAADLTEMVIAKTVNGSIQIATAGRAMAKTVNGSIEARLGSLGEIGGLEFETVNGQITVYVPEGADAMVSGATMNGSIKSDFPLRVDGSPGHRRLTGVLGDGGEELTLKSLNGSIRLLRGR
jgi:hypothetical protein